MTYSGAVWKEVLSDSPLGAEGRLVAEPYDSRCCDDFRCSTACFFSFSSRFSSASAISFKLCTEVDRLRPIVKTLESLLIDLDEEMPPEVLGRGLASPWPRSSIELRRLGLEPEGEGIGLPSREMGSGGVWRDGDGAGELRVDDVREREGAVLTRMRELLRREGSGRSMGEGGLNEGRVEVGMGAEESRG